VGKKIDLYSSPKKIPTVTHSFYCDALRLRRTLALAQGPNLGGHSLATKEGGGSGVLVIEREELGKVLGNGDRDMASWRWVKGTRGDDNSFCPGRRL
jgi:hypothetical protein